MDAFTMARAVRPPEVVLPRLGWLPLVGPLCARVLPPRRWTGRVLSWQEFEPFRLSFARMFVCAACGEERQLCSCAPEVANAPTAEEATDLLRRFVTAQGFSWRVLQALPGAVLDEVMRELFLSQTVANTPRMKNRPRSSQPDQTSGNSSLPKGDAKPRESPTPQLGSVTAAMP